MVGRREPDEERVLREVRRATPVQGFGSQWRTSFKMEGWVEGAPNAEEKW